MFLTSLSCSVPKACSGFSPLSLSDESCSGVRVFGSDAWTIFIQYKGASVHPTALLCCHTNAFPIWSLCYAHVKKKEKEEKAKLQLETKLSKEIRFLQHKNALECHSCNLYPLAFTSNSLYQLFYNIVSWHYYSGVLCEMWVFPPLSSFEEGVRNHLEHIRLQTIMHTLKQCDQSN